MKFMKNHNLICLAFVLTLSLFICVSPVTAAPTNASPLAQLLSEQNPAPSPGNVDPARPILPRKEVKKAATEAASGTEKTPKLTMKGKSRVFGAETRIAGNTAEERIKNALATAGAPLAKSASGANDSPGKTRVKGMKAGQRAGLERLQAATARKGGVKFAMDKHGIPSHLAGADIGAELPVASDAESKRGRAKNFLRANKDLLLIADPDTELHLKKEERDSLGKSHYRFQQTYQGIPVYGRESLVHLDDAGNIYLFQGHHLPTPTMADVTPNITRNEALAVCAADLGKAVGTVPSSELVIYYNESDENNYLTWHIDAYPSINEAWRYFIDAKTGNIITKYSIIMNAAVSASGLDLNGVRQNFTAWQSGSTYYCYDVTRPYNDSATWTASATGKGDIQIYDGRYDPSPVPSSASVTSGWDPAAVSVISNIYKTLDYYQSTHLRSGIDGNAGHVKTFIHQVGTAGNAYWNGSYLAFGDDQLPTIKLPGSLDIVAHEIAHGVTQYTAALEYQNQSGALNESMSDFFAAMVDRDDWLIGEDAYRGSLYHLRDMRNPHNADDPQPASMSEYQYYPSSQDHGGVHTNSGIPNRAAYLVAEGLTAEGSGTSIGKDKTEKIWYRALTLYLSKYSTFWHARWATEQAATDLYGQGSPETSAVQAAWDAVEVNDSSSSVTNAPTSVDPIVGEDRLVYVWDGGIYEQDSTGTISGPLNEWVARDTRPAVYYGTDDTMVFYVATGSFELWAVSLNSGTNSLVDDSIEWWSLAASPDGNYLAYTKNISEPYIYIFDGQTKKSFALYNPTTGTNSKDSSTIEYPDALSFDYRSRYVIYDYLNSIPSDLGTNEYWRFGILDIRDGTIVLPVTDPDPNFHVGNPVFAANNDYIIAFDLVNSATNESVVVTLNASNGEFGLVFDPDLDGLNRAEVGWPSFRGDDNAISMQSVKTVCPLLCYEERRIISVPLTVEGDGTWSGVGASAVYLTDPDGQYPVIYRAGTRLLDARLSPSSSTINFGLVAVDKTSSTVTLENVGNVDLFISNAAVTGAGLTLSGTLGRLPRNATMPITVTLDSKLLSGARTGSLTITSDADTPAVTIPISATIKPRYKLTVNKSGIASGSVSPDSGALSWVGNLGTANYFSGTIVSLTATAADGAVFAGWSGACTGLGSCQVNMTTLKSVTATFSALAAPTGNLIIPVNDPDGSYTINWAPSATSGVTYSLEEATNAEFTIGKRVAYTGALTSANITLRTKGLAYYYRIRSNKTGWVSSDWVTGSNDCKISPAMPAGITVPLIDDDGSLVLKWSASITLGSSYEVERSTDVTFSGGTEVVYSGPALTATVAAVTTVPGVQTIYYFRVRATKVGFPESPWKAGLNGCKVGTPAVPATLTVPATDPDGSYTIAWAPSPTAGVTYTLEEATTAEFTTGKRVAYNGALTSANITLRTKGLAYYYRVLANKTGWAPSVWISGSNDCKISPAIPAGITVPLIDDDGSLIMKWSASVTPGAAYEVERSTDISFASGTEVVYSGPALTATVSAVTTVPGVQTIYYFRVRATKVGFPESPWKAGVNGCKIGTPEVPATLTVPTTDLDGNYTIAWAPSATAGVTYTLEEATTADFTIGKRVAYTGALTSANITLRAKGLAYYYRVHTNKTGWASSGWASGSSDCKISPAMPVGITVPLIDDDGSLVLKWSASVTLGSSYEVERSTDATFSGGPEVVYSGSALTVTTAPAITVPGIQTTYYFRVRANKAGFPESPWKVGLNGCKVGTPEVSATLSVPASDLDGKYTIVWAPSTTAGVTYTLEEATTADFTLGKRAAYTGIATTVNIATRVIGKTYYYRVRATKTGFAASGWTTAATGCRIGL